mmetsp:Transcript_37249/g.92102  ORF Transcript_37249/g.92102 Transcript_37249/m.92102 type:complete len:255 (+) Transcript_37249:546-1310(+)
MGVLTSHASLNSSYDSTLSAPALSLNILTVSSRSAVFFSITTLSTNMVNLDSPTNPPGGSSTWDGATSGLAISSSVSRAKSTLPLSNGPNIADRMLSCRVLSRGIILPESHVLQNSVVVLNISPLPDMSPLTISTLSISMSHATLGSLWYSPASRTNWQMRRSVPTSYSACSENTNTIIFFCASCLMPNWLSNHCTTYSPRGTRCLPSRTHAMSEVILDLYRLVTMERNLIGAMMEEPSFTHRFSSLLLLSASM